MNVLRIDIDSMHRLTQDCATRYPEEACGILIGHLGSADDPRRVMETRAAANVWTAEQRGNRFLIDPTAQLAAERDAAAAGMDVVGFYHSHPDADPVPSPRDLDAAWPVYSYLIVRTTPAGAGEARCWQLNVAGDAFMEVPIEHL